MTSAHEPEQILGFTCVQCMRDIPREEVRRHVQYLGHQVRARTNSGHRA